MLIQIIVAEGLAKVLFAVGLVVVTVCIHAVGFSVLLRAMIRSHALATSGFWRITSLVTVLAGWLTLIHLGEISVWGLFYFWQGCMPDNPDVGSALYFSGVTYTSLGYGDQLLPKAWRMFAPLETLTGILMCGLSTGLFFAIVNRFVRQFHEGERVRASLETRP